MRQAPGATRRSKADTVVVTVLVVMATVAAAVTAVLTDVVGYLIMLAWALFLAVATWPLRKGETKKDRGAASIPVTLTPIVPARRWYPYVSYDYAPRPSGGMMRPPRTQSHVVLHAGGVRINKAVLRPSRYRVAVKSPRSAGLDIAARRCR